MKKPESAIIIILIVVLAMIFLDAGQIDDAINSVFNPVDKSCNIDSDCALTYFNCISPCSTYVANKNWEPFCPIPYNRPLVMCQILAPGELKCTNKICNYV
jgi:hypothetical protein